MSITIFPTIADLPALMADARERTPGISQRSLAKQLQSLFPKHSEAAIYARVRKIDNPDLYRKHTNLSPNAKAFEALRLQHGDTVKIERRGDDNADGWVNEWIPEDMDRALGKTGTVHATSREYGVQVLDLPDFGDAYWYPIHHVSVVARKNA